MDIARGFVKQVAIELPSPRVVYDFHPMPIAEIVVVDVFFFALFFCYAKKAMFCKVLQVECVFNFHVLLVEKKHPGAGARVPKVMQITNQTSFFSMGFSMGR